MVYGFVRVHNRLSNDQYRYRSVSKSIEYVYVESGFFGVRNVFFSLKLPLSVTTAIVSHVMYLIGIYQLIVHQKFATMMFGIWYGWWCGVSITAGAHRLWAHRSYEAHWSVRLFLAIGFTISGQSSILDWCRGHRVHHKWSDTDSDPHNVKRGFWFAHLGWLYATEHPDVIRAETQIRTDDLESDPIVHFQHKYYLPLFYIWSAFIPILLHVLVIGDTWIDGIIVGCLLRNMETLHATAFVNSAAHMFGYRPYNSKIMSVENVIVSMGGMGEGMTSFRVVTIFGIS